MNGLGRHLVMYAQLAILLAILCPSAWAPAEEVATQPATTTAPAEPPEPPLDPAVERILDRLQAKGDKIDSIEAKIEFIKIDPVLEDRQEHRGILRFKQASPNPRFFIEFDRFRHEGITTRRKQWHVFDGRWYIEARETTATITRREIVRPGETLEVFKLGQGPFPLPFGQRKADILQHFSVKVLPPKTEDPKHTDHLECTPRPDSEMARKYDTVHFYIDKTLDLPVRVQTREKQEGIEIIASFEDIKVNPGLVESLLNLPDLSGYETDTIPLPPADNP